MALGPLLEHLLVREEAQDPGGPGRLQLCRVRHVLITERLGSFDEVALGPGASFRRVLNRCVGELAGVAGLVPIVFAPAEDHLRLASLEELLGDEALYTPIATHLNIPVPIEIATS